MAMTAEDTRKEIKRLYLHTDEIERRYPDRVVSNNEDLAELKLSLEQIDTHEATLPGLEDQERRIARIKEGVNHWTRPGKTPAERYADDVDQGRRYSPGSQFISDPKYKDVVQSGALNSPLNRIEFAISMKDGTSLVEWNRRLLMEQKTLLYGSSASSGGGFVVNDHRPGLVDILQREITFLDIVPRLTTDSDVVEYVREDTFTNNAAFVAEASVSTGTTGSKPESALAYSTQTTNVQALAHYLPVTNRLLSDAPAIRGIIDGRLLLGLTLALETQVLTGDGTGVNFTGILNTGSVLTQAIQANENRLDTLFRARTQVRVTGHARPNVIVLHPNDFQDIRLLREGTATGQYLMGPPSQVGASTIWGMPVVESEAITSGSGLVADMIAGCALFDREQAAVRVGLINDQFVRNMQTVLAELRAAFVVWRPTAFCLATGI